MSDRASTELVRSAQYLASLLVTDTMVFEVVGRTAKTLKLRRTKDGERRWTDEACDKGAYGLSVEWVEQVPDPGADVRIVKVRKDGSYRVWSDTKLRIASDIDGAPVRRIDHRY